MNAAAHFMIVLPHYCPVLTDACKTHTIHQLQTHLVALLQRDTASVKGIKQHAAGEENVATDTL